MEPNIFSIAVSVLGFASIDCEVSSSSSEKLPDTSPPHSSLQLADEAVGADVSGDSSFSALRIFEASPSYTHSLSSLDSHGSVLKRGSSTVHPTRNASLSPVYLAVQVDTITQIKLNHLCLKTAVLVFPLPSSLII